MIVGGHESIVVRVCEVVGTADLRQSELWDRRGDVQTTVPGTFPDEDHVLPFVFQTRTAWASEFRILYFSPSSCRPQIVPYHIFAKTANPLIAPQPVCATTV